MSESRKPKAETPSPRGRRCTQHAVAPPLVGDGPRITPCVYNPDTRPKHRFRAATLAIPFVAALAAAFATDTTLGFPLPAGAGPDGAAPAWGASMAVGPYAEVNLRTGHVLTRLPVVGWSGGGSAVAFFSDSTITWKGGVTMPIG